MVGFGVLVGNMTDDTKGEPNLGRPPNGDGLTSYERKKRMILRGVTKPRHRPGLVDGRKPKSATTDEVTQ